MYVKSIKLFHENRRQNSLSLANYFYVYQLDIKLFKCLSLFLMHHKEFSKYELHWMNITQIQLIGNSRCIVSHLLLVNISITIKITIKVRNIKTNPHGVPKIQIQFHSQAKNNLEICFTV